jgi:hypothetical protein
MRSRIHEALVTDLKTTNEKETVMGWLVEPMPDPNDEQPLSCALLFGAAVVIGGCLTAGVLCNTLCLVQCYNECK